MDSERDRLRTRLLLSGALVALLLAGPLAQRGAAGWNLGLRYGHMQWTMAEMQVFVNEDWSWQGVSGESWWDVADDIEIRDFEMWGPELAWRIGPRWEIKLAGRLGSSRLRLRHSASSPQGRFTSSWNYDVEMDTARYDVDLAVRRSLGSHLHLLLGIRYQRYTIGEQEFRTELLLDGQEIAEFTKYFRR